MYTKKWLLSPFFESRGNYPLDMIVIHHIGSQNGKLYSVKGTLSWFTDINVHKNKETGKIENKVSAHYVIPRNQHESNDLYYLVQDKDIAYHAGISQWVINGKIRKYINRYSIGIELEGDGNLIEYTDYQYDVLIWLIKDLMNTHLISENNIVGHEDIAPERKVDPGKLFDWKKLRCGINPPVLVSVSKIPEVVSSEINNPTENPSVSCTPTSEIPKVPDQDFYMGDGSKMHGGFMLFFKKIFEVLLRMFDVS